MDHVKICPRCDCEYLSEALACADCGVALVWSSQGPKVEPGELGEADWEAFAPEEILGQVTGDLEDIIKIYLGYFKAAGIPGAILPHTRYHSNEVQISQSPVFGNVLMGGQSGQAPVGDVSEGFLFDLFVRRTDYDRAKEIVEEQFPGLHPGQEEGFNREFELGACPACESPVPEDAGECPDCGLFLGD